MYYVDVLGGVCFCMEEKEAKLEQLLSGINKLCAGREDCTACPFFTEECVFGEPKPRTWVREETVEAAPDVEVAVETAPAAEPEVSEKPVEPAAKPEKVEEAPVEAPVPPQDDDSPATWLLSTSMGSVFTKYVFICSKCGFKKESVFSIPPITFCPECEKRKAGQ